MLIPMTNDLQIKKKYVEEKLNDFGEGSDLLVLFLFH